MIILLISPSVDANTRTNKGLMIPQLSLYILKGLTPPEHEVKIIEEEIANIDLEQDCNLVGISCMTANSQRAYYFCHEFKKRGKTVVIGGVHPTILPDEALQHADGVVVGEAEGVWESLLNDFQNNNLKRKYCNPQPDLRKYIPKDFSKIIKKRLFNIIPLMTSRGCPYDCEFCCVTNLFGKQIRHVPIENVVRDIKEAHAKNFIFLDDNVIGHPRYAKELFKAIIPLKINWVGQASISLLVNNNELLRLAAESGCKALFIGIESVGEQVLHTMPKVVSKIKQLGKGISKVKKMGILVHASMIFGFDNDTKEIFKESVRFLKRMRVCTASFNILTPYPGTKVHEDLKYENRLITNNWRYYDQNTVVFKPRNMTPYELQIGKINAKKEFYSLLSVLNRVLGNLYHPVIYFAMNYGHIKQIKVEAKKLTKIKSELFESIHNEESDQDYN